MHYLVGSWLRNHSLIPLELSETHLKCFTVLSHLRIDLEKYLSISSCPPKVEGSWEGGAVNSQKLPG